MILIIIKIIVPRSTRINTCLFLLFSSNISNDFRMIYRYNAKTCHNMCSLQLDVVKVPERIIQKFLVKKTGSLERKQVCIVAFCGHVATTYVGCRVGVRSAGKTSVALQKRILFKISRCQGPLRITSTSASPQDSHSLQDSSEHLHMHYSEVGVTWGVREK